jgi:MFS family permease
MASGEYRAIYAASALSWFGDSMARAAVTAMVYTQTDGSILASSATFAISYLPWLGIGPVLTALAERYPLRRVLVICDLIRMCTMALVAVPDIPLPVTLLLLFLTALLNPPFDAARSALLPRVLDGDRLVVGVSMQLATAQAMQITGYFAGGALAVYQPRLTLLLNAATFGVSACLIGLGVHARGAANGPEQRRHLLRETAAGFSLVFGTPVLRSIAFLVFGTMLFTIVPEGLAAGWAGQLTDNLRDRGWMQGLIMMANPVGWVIGGLLFSRLTRPSVRQRLIRPVGLLAPFALIFALFAPPVHVVALISFLCGCASGALLPATNGLFVRALPDAFRARAFGVMASGIQLLQGVAVFATGALADRFTLPIVVGVWGAAGLVLMLFVISTWPRPERVTQAIEAAEEANAAAHAAAEAAAPAPTGQAARAHQAGRHRANSAHARSALNPLTERATR